MAGTNQMNTMGEGIRKFMDLIGKMKLTPDADLPLLIELETSIIAANKSAMEQSAASGASAMQPGATVPPAGMGMMGGPMGGSMPPGPPPSPSTLMGQGGRGMTTYPSMPQGAEMARMLNR